MGNAAPRASVAQEIQDNGQLALAWASFPPAQYNAVRYCYSRLLSRTLVLHRHFAPALSPSSLVLLRGQAGPAPYTALALFSLLFPSSPTFLSSASAPAVALIARLPLLRPPSLENATRMGSHRDRVRSSFPLFSRSAKLNDRMSFAQNPYVPGARSVVETNPERTSSIRSWKPRMKDAMDECQQARFKYKFWALHQPRSKPEGRHSIQDQKNFSLDNHITLTAEGEEYRKKLEAEVLKTEHHLKSLAQDCLDQNKKALCSTYQYAVTRTETVKARLETFAHVQLPETHWQDLARYSAAYEVQDILRPFYAQASAPRLISGSF